MNPCRNNKKDIALMALEELETRRAAVLREHLEDCEGCRRYWEDISKVADGLASAVPEAEIEPSESFRHSVAERLRKIQSASVWNNPGLWLRRWRVNWGVAVPAMAVLVISLLTVINLRHPAVPPSAQPGAQPGKALGAANDLTPTLHNYQIAAYESMQKFDELLSRQGDKNLPHEPAYTASSLAIAAASFR